ncbi:MAG: ComF family protein [Nevskia sp.]|nr:ComF family protein [Nevskia sp.]
MGAMVDSLLGALVGALLPGRCTICRGAAADLLCGPCRAELPWNRVACPGCARPQIGPAAFICARCTVRPPPFEQAWSAFRYAWPVDAAIHRLKYHADFRGARWLGTEMARALSARPEALPQVLLPVPLHGGRLRRRGYNQAMELARALSRALSVPVDAAAARRLRATEDQIGKSAAQRRRNVKGAFAAKAQRVQGLHVALVDDVMTTGSTLAELAAECRKAGAARVEVWTAARAV